MTGRLPLSLVVVAFAACHPAGRREIPPPQPALADTAGRVGVLVMAHGGDAEWNRTVAEAVAPLAATVPTAVAYGMADPGTLAAGLRVLADSGVRRVAVVRLFISGSAFRDQTDYLLGLSATPPARFFVMGAPEGAPDPEPLDHGLSVATHDDGLMTSPQAGRILAERAAALSSAPEQESVLILAHGMGDDGENQRVLDAMAAAARAIEAAGFASVRVATLREDWEAKREVSEREVRDYVSGQSLAGRTTLVLPMRLSGFGPYAEVLDGLDYRPAEGLLPHGEVSAWIRATAAGVACDAGWGAVIDPCVRVAVRDTSPAP